MTLSLSPDLADARLQVVGDACAGGTLTLYTADQPAAGAAITTQTALVTFAIPSGLAVVAHSLDLQLSTETIATTGEAVWGRITDAADAWVLDGDCGLVASDALFRLKTTALTGGSSLNVITASFAEA